METQRISTFDPNVPHWEEGLTPAEGGGLEGGVIDQEATEKERQRILDARMRNEENMARLKELELMKQNLRDK
jgi:hypothetical protein